MSFLKWYVTPVYVKLFFQQIYAHKHKLHQGYEKGELKYFICHWLTDTTYVYVSTQKQHILLFHIYKQSPKSVNYPIVLYFQLYHCCVVSNGCGSFWVSRFVLYLFMYTNLTCYIWTLNYYCCLLCMIKISRKWDGMTYHVHETNVINNVWLDVAEIIANTCVPSSISNYILKRFKLIEH